MKISRRDFLQNSLVTGVGAFAVLNDPLIIDINKPYDLRGIYRGEFPILQGLTTQTTAQFTILVPKNKSLSYVITDSSSREFSIRKLNSETRAYSAWGVEKLIVTDLKINTDYAFKVIDSLTGKTLDQRVFRSLDTNLTAPKIMIASCMKDHKAGKREEMWDNVAATSPDMIFLIGDTCYADRDNNGSDEDYWRRYVETRTLLSHFRQQRLIPTLAIWDDHDFCGNNADGTFKKKDMTRSLFKLFWDNEPQEESLIKGPGVSQVFTAFGQRFFMMDSRFYRSSRQETNNPMHWGAQQEEFLFDNLYQSKSPTWLMNGSQFFGGYLQKDAFEYWHLKNFQNVCRELAKAESPIVFASGDVHFTEYMAIEPQVLGYSTFEITSSAIHSTTFPGNHLRKKNPRRIAANSSHQFTNVRTYLDAEKGWVLDAQSFKAGLKTTLKQTMIVKR